MKRHLNTLYVTSQGAYLAKDGDTVLVRVEQETRLRLPIHTLDVQLGVPLESAGDVDGIKALVEQILRRHGDRMGELDLDPQTHNPLDVRLDDLGRQPKGRGDGQHSPCNVFGFKNGHLDAVEGQKVGRGKA